MFLFFFLFHFFLFFLFLHGQNVFVFFFLNYNIFFSKVIVWFAILLLLVKIKKNIDL